DGGDGSRGGFTRSQRGGVDARRNEDNQFGLFVLEAFAGKQLAQNRNAAENRNLGHRFTNRVGDQAAQGDGAAGGKSYFGHRSATIEAGNDGSGEHGVADIVVGLRNLGAQAHGEHAVAVGIG